MKITETIEGIKPLSINAAWQGRRYKTKDYKDFEEDMLLLLPKREMVEGWVEVHYIIGLTKGTSYSRSDIGNFEKLISDLIVKAGYIKDDCYIKKMTLEKVLADDWFIDIQIKSVNRE